MQNQLRTYLIATILFGSKEPKQNEKEKNIKKRKKAHILCLSSGPCSGPCSSPNTYHPAFPTRKYISTLYRNILLYIHWIVTTRGSRLPWIIHTPTRKPVSTFHFQCSLFRLCTRNSKEISQRPARNRNNRKRNNNQNNNRNNDSKSHRHTFFVSSHKHIPHFNIII